jgi:copper chaperone NosL
MIRTAAVGLLGLMALVVAGAACGTEQTGPPDIEYGRDVCDECHMIISEARYAAAYRDADGNPSIFDDIGDMLEHGRSSGTLDDAVIWVHDFGTEEWIEAPQAWFVEGGDVETPMAGQIVAFETEADARRFAEDNGGEVRSWTALLADAEAGGPVSEHDHMSD